MIQANELRIGNWVNAKFMTDNFNFQVKAVYDDAALYKPNIQYHTSTIYPIPLTEEILLKCGFTENGIWYEKEDFKYNICRPDGASFFEVYLLGHGSPIYIADLSNFHQLQNLYLALTHTELNVKL